MPIFGRQIFVERDNRPVVLFRYIEENIHGIDLQSMNRELCKCKIIKKNSLQHLFIISCGSDNFEILTKYDDQRYCYVIDDLTIFTHEIPSNIDLDLVNYIKKDLQFAIKEEGWKYINAQSAFITSELFDEIEALDNYDVKAEEYLCSCFTSLP